MGSEGPSESGGRELRAGILSDWLEELVWLSLVVLESEMERVETKIMEAVVTEPVMSFGH